MMFFHIGGVLQPPLLSFIISKRRSATPRFLLWPTCHIEPGRRRRCRQSEEHLQSKTRAGTVYIIYYICLFARLHFVFQHFLLADNSGRKNAINPYSCSSSRQRKSTLWDKKQESLENYFELVGTNWARMYTDSAVVYQARRSRRRQRKALERASSIGWNSRA